MSPERPIDSISVRSCSSLHQSNTQLASFWRLVSLATEGIAWCRTVTERLNYSDDNVHAGAAVRKGANRSSSRLRSRGMRSFRFLTMCRKLRFATPLRFPQTLKNVPLNLQDGKALKASKKHGNEVVLLLMTTVRHNLFLCVIYSFCLLDIW